MIACSCLASALLAVGGMTNGVQIARTPVTNAEYAEFANATGHSIPRYWKNGIFPQVCHFDFRKRRFRPMTTRVGRMSPP